MPDARHATANRHMQSGAYHTAIQLYESMLEDMPDNADVLNDAGLAYAHEGRKKQAKKYFRRALKVQPDHDTAFFNLLDILQDTEGPASAADAFHAHGDAIPESQEKTQYLRRLQPTPSPTSKDGQCNEVGAPFLALLEQAHGACARYDSKRCNNMLSEVEAGIQALSPALQPKLSDHLHQARSALQKDNVHQSALHLWAMWHTVKNDLPPTSSAPSTANDVPRVLFLGSLSTAFVPPLVQGLKQQWQPHRPYAMGLLNPDTSPISDVHADLFEALYSYPVFASNPSLFKELYRHRDFDLYHFHFVHPRFLQPLFHLPPDKPVILSIWGSDLFRVAGPEAYKVQYQAFQRADLITLHGPEMREVFLSKFGRDLMPKIHYTLFQTETGIYRAIDRYDRAEARDRFAEKYGIDSDQTIVCVGHNADPMCQHRAVLRQLASLPPAYRRRIAVVLPMTYKQNSDYIASIRTLADSLDLDVHILTQFMSEEAVGQLRLSSDLFIHVPASDAFSGAMCETLYAGNVVLTGAWLPYGRLRASDAYYHEVATLDAISKSVSSIVKRLPEERERASDNPAVIQSLLDPSDIAAQWASAYDKALGLAT